MRCLNPSLYKPSFFDELGHVSSMAQKSVYFNPLNADQIR